MKIRKKVQTFFVLLVVTAYSATFPVLSVLHSHTIQFGSSSTKTISSKDERVSGNIHYLSCAICVRGYCSQALVNFLSHFQLFLPSQRFSLYESTLNCTYVEHTNPPGRAPPYPLG